MAKILYYRYYITKNGERTNADLLDLLDHIKKLPPKYGMREKGISYKGREEKLLLNNIIIPDKDKTNNTIHDKTRILVFSRKRKEKPYVTKDDTDEYNKIPDNQKVIELATTLIIPELNLLLIHKNIHSANIRLISDYLKSFFYIDDNSEELDIEFIPMYIPTQYEDIQNADKITKLEFKFDTKRLGTIIPKSKIFQSGNVYEDYDYLTKKQYEVYNSMGVPDFKISLSNGYFKKGIDKEGALAMINFIKEINNEDDTVIKKIDVTIKCKNLKTKKIDLTTDGHRHFEIETSNKTGEEIGNLICSNYYDNKSNVVDSETIYLENFIINPQTHFIKQ